MNEKRGPIMTLLPGPKGHGYAGVECACGWSFKMNGLRKRRLQREWQKHRQTDCKLGTAVVDPEDPLVPRLERMAEVGRRARGHVDNLVAEGVDRREAEGTVGLVGALLTIGAGLTNNPKVKMVLLDAATATLGATVAPGLVRDLGLPTRPISLTEPEPKAEEPEPKAEEPDEGR